MYTFLILPRKLNHRGFNGTFYLLLKNFLSDRAELVSVCNRSSKKIHLGRGGSQGSVLPPPPLLFDVFINDISKSIAKCTIYKYAADMDILSRYIKYETVVALLQDYAIRVVDWFSNDILTVNVRKTQLV